MSTTPDKHIPMRDAIAFTLYLQSWLRENETTDIYTDENLKELWLKWEYEWLISLEEEHYGDCVKMPCACVRCHTEEYLKEAQRILSASKYGEDRENSLHKPTRTA